MKKTYWSLGLALAALVVLVAPGATPAEEAGTDLPAVQAVAPAPEAAPAPAVAAPFDLATALAAPAATPVTAEAETLDLEPRRMACNPPECSTPDDCPGGGACKWKCCV